MSALAPRGDSAPAPLRPIGRALVLACSLTVIAWAAAGTWGLGQRLLLDENGHYGQIRLFLDGRLALFKWGEDGYPASAMFPGFHAVLAAVAWATGLDSPTALRAFCFLGSLAFWLVAYLLARRLVGGDYALLRATQAYFVPIVFPFCFLIYTDVFSLLVTTAAFLACIDRRLNVCGLLMLLALGVRQNNVVFSAFLIAFSYAERHDRLMLASLARHLRHCWLLVAGIVAFAAYVLVHGRVGLDDPSNQPTTLSPGNVAFSLLCCGLCFSHCT